MRDWIWLIYLLSIVAIWPLFVKFYGVYIDWVFKKRRPR